MRILIAEDDLGSRMFLKQIMKVYGDCDVAVDGLETVDAFLMAWDEEQPYELICLDIMMPRLDGLKALQIIRDLEEEKKIPKKDQVKVIMTTALNEQQTVYSAFELGCEAFAAKPISQERMQWVLEKMGAKPIQEPVLKEVTK